jgi:hypothetical protein
MYLKMNLTSWGFPVDKDPNGKDVPKCRNISLSDREQNSSTHGLVGSIEKKSLNKCSAFQSKEGSLDAGENKYTAQIELSRE